MPSRLSLLPASAMTLTSVIWNESLGGLAPLNVFVSIDIYVIAQDLALTCSRQIRIIVDTHAHEKPNKKKKPHRGYAFVVFEREKDMRGKLFQSLSCYMTTPNPNSGGYTSKMWPSSLPICRSIPQETSTRPSSLPVSSLPNL